MAAARKPFELQRATTTFWKCFEMINIYLYVDKIHNSNSFLKKLGQPKYGIELPKYENLHFYP